MDDANGRSASEAPLDDEDFYGGDTPTCPTLDNQPVQENHAQEDPTTTATATTDATPAAAAAAAAAMPLTTASTAITATAESDAVNGDDEDDSSSEMDLSSPSRPSTPEPATLPAASPTAHAGAKRKLSDATDANHAAAVSTEDSAKKRKLSVASAKQHGEKPRIPQLPAEVWQRVFLHLPPAMLCRCLRVSKSFNEYLTTTSAPPAGRKYRPKIQVLDSETIWIQSRKTFFPTLPRPLSHFSEHDMLKLIGGRSCQFCHRAPAPSPATTVLNAGPGPNGLRVIWPFRIRSCGLCLHARSLKDVQVLGDPSLARLRNGVTHGFLSPDLHFAAESVRQTVPGGIPGNLRFSKIYYITDLEAIKGEEESARALGPGAVDEWHKGLFARGKESMADSARWEKWELQQLCPGQNLAHVLREYDIASFPRHCEEAQRRPVGVNGVQSSPTANGIHPLPQPVHFLQNGLGNHYQPPTQPPQHHLPAPPPFPAPMPPHHFFRPVRNPQEVEAARQARKAEIERRCREFEPSLEPNVLQHMESFQAAMQITTPMTDSAWEMLKPRIVAQREAAELAEHERASQLAALQAALPSGNMDDIVPRPAKETYDREYEQAQEPLRKQLGEYADDYINGKWGGGKMIDKDSAPLFALYALLHIRQRYAEDKSLGLLPRFEPPRRKDGAKQGSPPVEPFLSLDNMKWVYDNKVRPLTDVHRREHFICAGCAEEKKPKWFAFEGLIQHYGAKHTTAFSKGNIVVHWQTAEWPEEPPFHTNPSHWLKLDRRPLDYRNNSRARNTPHGNHESPFPAPSSAPALPDNPYHAAANGYSTVSPGYPAHYAPPGDGAANGFFYQPSAVADPDIDMSHDAQVAKLSNDAREVWDALDGVKDMMECIRIHTVIHHAVSRFAERFHQKPHLDLVTDALATNAVMRPLKNAHGLACRTCVAAQPNGAGKHGSYWIRVKDIKAYNTSSLITHLKVMHQHQVQGGLLDWTRDMIELPEVPLVRDLLRAPGMNDEKLALVAAAFPSAFPPPLPKIGIVSVETSHANAGGLPASRLLTRLGKKQKAAPKKKGGKQSNGVSDRDNSHEPLPEPTEDEYDPRRPIFVSPTEQGADPSQFDTDARKKSPLATVPSGAGILDLTPETLAALKSLGVLPAQQQPQPPQNGRSSRSPSVGGAEPSAPSQAVSNTPVTTPTGAPDIAAILASLTGQAAPVAIETPPKAVSNRSGSVSRQCQHEHPHKPNHEPVARQRHDEWRPSSRYEPAPPTSHNAGGLDLQAIQAALSQNSRHFEQNQHQHHTYVDAPYAPPPQPTPRYHYVYEGEQHYTQPQGHAPAYREAPVQYMPLPEREPARYQYEQPAPPKPIYVDQYGRPLELIPIDSAPVPVQYAPSPYEQQGRRHEQPMYTTTMAPSAHLQPVYDDRRPMYYEPVPPNGAAQRYMYDDARASVPRN